MAEEFDNPFKELGQSVMEDMKRVYSEKTIDHFLNPKLKSGIENIFQEHTCPLAPHVM